MAIELRLPGSMDNKMRSAIMGSRRVTEQLLPRKAGVLGSFWECAPNEQQREVTQLMNVERLYVNHRKKVRGDALKTIIASG